MTPKDATNFQLRIFYSVFSVPSVVDLLQFSALVFSKRSENPFFSMNTWLQSLRLLSSPINRISGCVQLIYSFGAPAASILSTAPSPAITRSTSSSSDTAAPNFLRTSASDKSGGDQFAHSFARGRLRILSFTSASITDGASLPQWPSAYWIAWSVTSL